MGRFLQSPRPKPKPAGWVPPEWPAENGYRDGGHLPIVSIASGDGPLTLTTTYTACDEPGWVPGGTDTLHCYGCGASAYKKPTAGEENPR